MSADDSLPADDDDPDPMAPLPVFCHSTETDLPFARCLDCEQALIPNDPDEVPPSYHIQKLVVRGEVVFEFALCMDCVQQLYSRMSRQTRQNLAAFFAQRIPFDSLHGPSDEATWRNLLLQVETRTLECLVCGRVQKTVPRYNFGCLCWGDQLLLRPRPIVLCEHCEGEMAGLISEETRKEWDRFVEEHFDSPPGVSADSPRGMPLLI